MSRNPLNTIAIENFLQAAKVAGKTNQRELKLDAKQYKDLADSIGIVLARLVELQDNALANPTEEVINIQMDGGNF
jgi:hypothetical protein